jgi:predicted RNA-binding Zn ribbon-like protein
MDGSRRARPGSESPAALLLRDFANTRDVESEADSIDTPGRLVNWLAERSLVPEGTQADERDLATARTFREGLRAAMLAHHDRERAPDLPSDLDGTLGRLPLRLAMPRGAGGRPALVPAGEGTSAGLARLAAAIMDAVADGSWPRLKVCLEHSCQWAFLDTSKNRSRSWCSMSVCGNRTKTRAYRARRRGGEGGHDAG